MDSLTKENTWNALEAKYPKAFAHFSEWMDNYKKEVNWDKLFNNLVDPEMLKDLKPYAKDGDVATKFHDLPFELQIGVLLRYMAEHHTDLDEDFSSLFQETKDGIGESFEDIEKALAIKDIADKF